MTKLLQQAVGRVSQLPEVDQDAIAQRMLDELESDVRWSKLVESSPESLSKLADRAWAEHEAGGDTGSEALDPETL